ncbi:MAG: hypothetical protein ONB46_13670 [candidate division KSB1 bacterium]|nr:hypothetical protein [candidate division KSB1 bacterium]MDZ7367507.1 hypothetical protein [candidate division KSB1 bacterium]MDZ7404934.1 hypothetical protein [candidate division KSB1 bacterium]
MKDIHCDAEGDILTVIFVKTTDKPQAEKHLGCELAKNFVFYFDSINEAPSEIIVISYSRLVEYTRRTPLKLDMLASYPKRLQRTALKLIQQPPVSNFLELKTSDTEAYHAVRVKKLVLRPAILDETA